jgi:hypothetical protein
VDEGSSLARPWLKVHYAMVARLESPSVCEHVFLGWLLVEVLVEDWHSSPLFSHCAGWTDKLSSYGNVLDG